MVSRAKRKRIARRDNMLCGIHLGGCGKPIDKDLTADHIIPRWILDKLTKGIDRDVDGDWNLQPMHYHCNNKRGSQIEGWPQFTCKCHYLHVMGNDLFICTKHPLEKRRHRFVRGIIARNDKDTPMIAVMGSWKGKGGTQNVGWKKNQFGYCIMTVTRRRANLINIHEKRRVSLL